MPTVADILSFLDTLAPPAMKMDWDNVGLLCGNRNTPVEKVLVALDPFEDVCREAERWGAQLIVTHHPLIFDPLKNITDETSVGRCVRLLCRSGISAVNAHTNLDCAPGGVNDCLARTLGLTDVQVITPMGTDDHGREWGLLRDGFVPEQPLEAFLTTVKTRLGCEGLRYVSGGKPVCRVAVGGGACADGIFEAAAAGCDTLVTADVKYNRFWDARELGISLIDAGHFATENPVCTYLQEQIAAAFPEIAVKVSESNRDCMKFF